MNGHGQPGFHIMAKPIGPACNLNCTYCYYLEKTVLFPGQKKPLKMPDHVLETFIQKYITSQDVPEVSFVWQGGEPTLLGIDFFRKVIKLQNRWADGKNITNAIQTNGTRLNDKWCQFLSENRFLVGLSIDGPKEIHDRYRVDKAGKGTFKGVYRSLKMLQKHQAAVNALTCITRAGAGRALDVYGFLKGEGIQFIQFIPVVERAADETAQKHGLKLAAPPELYTEAAHTETTPWSIEPEAYGEFLVQVFDQWVKNDVGAVHVMNFEAALGAWMGLDAVTCVYARQCGRSLVIEHNGDIYACDHFVYPDSRIGYIMEDEPGELLRSPFQAAFGRRKEDALPGGCRECDVLFACRGECPKHRFCKTKNGEPGLNYLCKGYQRFFRYADKYMKTMALLINSGYPADRIMEAFKGPLFIGGRDA